MRRLVSVSVAAAVVLLALASVVSSGGMRAEAQWVITDLGTLGDEYSWAVAINGRGEVIGNSYVKRRGVSHAFVWKDGKMRDLGTLGGPNSTAVAINESDQIVGWADTKAKFKGGLPVSHAFLWENGKMRDLGTLGGKESRAVAINERGQIVGAADTTATFGGVRISHAFLWENGKMRDLGTPRRQASEAVAINEEGQVIFNTSTYDKQGVETSRAFLWEGGKVRDLGTLGGKGSGAIAINERGQIVGWASRKKDDYNAVLWQNGTIRDLGKLGYEAVAINDRGQVIGNGSRGFLWENGKTRFIGDRGSDTKLAGISEQGHIVGYRLSDEACDVPGMQGEQLPHGFIWVKGKMTTLPALRGRRVASSPGSRSEVEAKYSRAHEMNDSGEIVGWSESGRRTAGSDYCYEQGLHAVLWTPRPS